MALRAQVLPVSKPPCLGCDAIMVGWECPLRIELLASRQAVMQLAEEAIEHVAQRRGVAVPDRSAAVVERSSRRRSSKRGERPNVADRGQTRIFHSALHDDDALPGRSGDRG